MKRQDITLIAAISIIAAIFSVFISSLLFSGKSKQLSVPTVEQLSAQFPDVQHDPSYKAIFNSNALDPTQTITIGTGSNSQPFSGNQ